MKKKGCLVLLLGLLMVISGSTLFAFRLNSYTDGQLLTVLALKTGHQVTSDLLPAPPDRHYQVRCTFAVKIPGDDSHFRFPISYRITDEKGVTILSEEAFADPTSSRPWSMISVSRGDTGKAVNSNAEFTFGHFELPAPAKIRIEAELKPDPAFLENPERPELKIYHHAPEGPPPIGWDFWLFVFGGILAVVGLIILVAGLLKRKPAETAPHK